MSILPASLVVNVTVRANDNFVPRQGFGIPLLLTSVEKAGVLTSTLRTRAYGNMAEVADEWDPADAFYIAAQAAFSQVPHPTFIKAGFYDDTEAVDAATMAGELDLIRAYDSNWYWLIPEADLRDTTMAQGIIDWIATEERFAIIASNDELLKSLADETNIAAVNKGTTDNVAVIYSSTPAEYPDMATASALATFNLDEADGSYTAAFKRLRGITPENISTAEYGIITGLTPGVSADTDDGHLANAYINIIGAPQLQPGQTLTPQVFVDEVHFRHWLILRCREEILNVLLNNRKVPFTDQGLSMLAGGIKVVMNQARRNGALANDNDPETGEYLASFSIDVPSVFDVPESQRKARVAPAITVSFRYSGAVHFATVHFHISY